MIFFGCYGLQYPNDYGPTLWENPSLVTFNFIVVL